MGNSSENPPQAQIKYVEWENLLHKYIKDSLINITVS